MASNPLLEELVPCQACGAPVFTLTEEVTGEEPDMSVPRNWMLVGRNSNSGPVAGGLDPATVCTACGRITDRRTDRAILWNVRDNGSPVPKLVPPLERPAKAIYDWIEWDTPGAGDLLHLACLRGRWADDIELEAIATGRLLDAERRLYEGAYTNELAERAEALLRDDRLSWLARIELHAELGRSQLDVDDELAFRHLSSALALARDEQAIADLRGTDPDASWTSPDAPWLAIDAAEAAANAGRNTEALELLRWAVPRCSERDIQKRGASNGIDLAEQAGDRDFQLTCELVRLREQCHAEGDDPRTVRVAWPRIEELLAGDTSGERRASAIADVEHWYLRRSATELLRRLRRGRELPRS